MADYHTFHFTIPQAKYNTDDKDDNEDCFSDGESSLHGLCNYRPAAVDANTWECLIGKFVAKEFLPAYGDVMKLYTGVIEDYVQATDKYVIKYSDGDVETVNHKTALGLVDFFEYFC